MNEVTFTIAVVILIALLVIWGYHFIQLMLLADADFPGRFDKILWVQAFVFAPFAAPFAFMYWKQAYVVMRDEQKHPGGETGE